MRSVHGLNWIKHMWCNPEIGCAKELLNPNKNSGWCISDLANCPCSSQMSVCLVSAEFPFSTKILGIQSDSPIRHWRFSFCVIGLKGWFLLSVAVNAVCTGNLRGECKFWFQFKTLVWIGNLCWRNSSWSVLWFCLFEGFFFLCFKGLNGFVPLWFLLLRPVQCLSHFSTDAVQPKMTKNGIWGCPLDVLNRRFEFWWLQRQK